MKMISIKLLAYDRVHPIFLGEISVQPITPPCGYSPRSNLHGACSLDGYMVPLILDALPIFAFLNMLGHTWS